MKSLLLIISFFSLTLALAQDIEWGPLEKVKGRVNDVLPVSGSTFFTTRWSGGALLGSLYMSRHANFTILNQEKVITKVSTGTATIQRIVSFNSQVIVFLSDKKDGVNTLFMQKYDDLCIPEGDAIELTSYAMPKGWNKSGYFNVLQSQNKKFFCAEYSIPGTRDEKERFGYKIMNEKFETVSEGEYESPYESRQSDITNRCLLNTGDYFMVAKVYNVNEKGRVKDLTSLEKVVLMQITPEGTQEFDLNFDDKHITDLTFSSDNSRLLTFTGLYGEGGRNSNRSTVSTNTKGIFYFQLDYSKKQILNEVFQEFEKDFITEGWTDRQKKKADKREARGKGAPTFYSYDFREDVTLADGSLIGMMEQYYVVVVSRTDPKTGTTTYTYYYYYNDVIAYKVSPEGKFDWVKKIQKNQVSTNDGGYFSSIAQYTTNDKLVVLFNDNLKNYDETGNFLYPEKGKDIVNASYRKKTNCVARVEIDLKTGEESRRTFFNRSEAEAIAVPKLFHTDYNNKEMLMVLRIGKKEKFGLLKF